MRRVLGSTIVFALVSLTLAFILTACGSSDQTTAQSGSNTVLSANGTIVLSGSWSGCSGGGPYNNDTYSFSGSTFQVNQTSGHSLSNCSDAASGSLDITISLGTDGTKSSVDFSTDDVTPDAGPGGLSTPVTVTRVVGTVTASSDTGMVPLGTEFKDIWYVDDRNSPLILYRGHSSTDGNGYPVHLHTVDTLTQ